MADDSTSAATDDDSSDRQERIDDFLARHGGAGSLPTREERTQEGLRGWYEVYAADGYRLHCDWSRTGSREELAFSEIPPDRP